MDDGFQESEVLSTTPESTKVVMFLGPLYLGGFVTEIYSDFVFTTENLKNKRKVFPRFISISRSYNIVLFQQ